MNIKFKSISVAIIAVVAVICFFVGQSEHAELETLSLSNIEALANNEGGGGNIQCYDNGSVDCVGYKVKIKYEYSARELKMK